METAAHPRSLFKPRSVGRFICCSNLNGIATREPSPNQNSPTDSSKEPFFKRPAPKAALSSAGRLLRRSVLGSSTLGSRPRCSLVWTELLGRFRCVPVCRLDLDLAALVRLAIPRALVVVVYLLSSTTPNVLSRVVECRATLRRSALALSRGELVPRLLSCGRFACLFLVTLIYSSTSYAVTGYTSTSLIFSYTIKI